MDEEVKEELLQELEAAANFMREMTFDPSVGVEQRQALTERARRIDAMVEKHLD